MLGGTDYVIIHCNDKMFVAKQAKESQIYPDGALSIFSYHSWSYSHLFDNPGHISGQEANSTQPTLFMLINERLCVCNILVDRHFVNICHPKSSPAWSANGVAWQPRQLQPLGGAKLVLTDQKIH